ncbi:MAG: MBL fold metallo-hydrolase [Gammaproteobacteria bacterium]|nr:MBL fold metallo-hydrolase [Gammaproteobacteria bacterium]
MTIHFFYKTKRLFDNAAGMILVGAALLVVSGNVLHASEEAGPLRDKYHAIEVSDSVYVIHGPSGLPSPSNQGFMNNPGFIVTSEGVVVVDAGSSVQTGRMVLGQIKAVTDLPVVALFSTHIHGDHWLANQAIHDIYPEARSYAHPDLIQLARSGEAENWVDLMGRLTNGGTKGTVAVIPDSPVVDGDQIQIGDRVFSIHHKGKAHTTSDIAIMVMPGKVLFTGDLVFNKRLGRMDDGHFGGLSETLDHLIGLAPETVVPGHGMTDGVGIIQNAKRLNDLIHRVVQEKFEEGLSDFEIKPIVVERTSEFSDWDGFEQSIGRVVSLSYLEVEEENF